MFQPLSFSRSLLLVVVLLGNFPGASGAKLQQPRISKEYRYQLTSALRAYSIWLGVHSLPSVTDLIKSKDDLIRRTTDYVQYIYDQGGSLGVARRTVLALQTFHRHLK